MSDNERIAVLEIQTQTNKEAIVALHKDMKESFTGLETKFDTVVTKLDVVCSDVKAGKMSGKVLYTALGVIAGLVGFVISVVT